MSKIRVDQLETLDGVNTKDVATLVDDINTVEVTSSTGDQSLTDALDARANKDDLDTLESTPADGASFVAWNPEDQPGADTYTNYSGADATAFINDLWEPLRTSNPDWVSRRSLGTDESGLYDVWEYKFEPDYYERTIVIGCLVHGGEVMSMLGTHAFFRELANNYSSHPLLRFCREKIRWVVIPIVNPWGVSQSPRVRHNSNGVDINRNWGFRWSSYDEGGENPFDLNYKGSSVWSEAETRYFRDVIDVDYPEAVAAIDTHSFVNSGSSDKYIVYLPDYTGSTNRELFVDLVEELTRPGEEGLRLISSTYFPSSFNYFAREGYTSANPEYAPQSADGSSSPADGPDMTQVLRWFGNIYGRVATRQSGKQKVSFSPFVRQYSLTAATPTIPSSGSTYGAVLPEDTFTVDTHGVLELTGFASVRANAAPTQIFIKHSFGQDAAAREQFKSSNSTNTIESFSYISTSDGRETIPFSSAIPVFPGQTIRFTPEMRSSSGEGTLLRYSAAIRFTPIDGGNQYRWFTSTGTGDPWEDDVS